MANAYKLLMCGKSNIVIDEFYNNFSDEFDVRVPASEIIPENFNSAEALWDMIERLMDE